MASYDINYEDERFQTVEQDKAAALTESEKLYVGMIKDSDAYYQAQVDASKQWVEKQTELQNEQTDFTIEQIEQQREQEKKDYTKEQSGAYVDWQKQSNQYGANAEKQASSGLAGSGYSESSQVSMYNTYQNRVATARESFNNAILNYNNAIKDARLQNNSALAEIAYQALQQQLELSLQGFQYKNQLLLEEANKKLQIEESYYSRYQDVLAQINQENALAEQIRQYNESMAEEKRQFDESLAEEKRQFNKTYALQQTTEAGASEISKNSNLMNASADNNSEEGTTHITPKYNPDSYNFKAQSYEDAVDIMISMGVPYSYASNILTKGEFETAKRSGSNKHGEQDYESYEHYLAEVMAYNIAYNTGTVKNFGARTPLLYKAKE